MRILFFKFLYYLGLGHVLYYYQKINSRIPILVFHRINPIIDKFWTPLSPEQFETHIKFLLKKYRFISLDDLFNKPSHELHNCCAIVFDDAFKDFYEYALPVIRKYQIPVTMFVPVDSVENNQVIWTSQLDNCFKFTSKTALDIKINGNHIQVKLENERQKIEAAFKIQKLLVNLTDKQRRDHVKNIKSILGYREDPNVKIMSWPEIKEIMHYVRYESHSMTHSVLPNIEDEATLNYELHESKNILENKLHVTVNYFAYPIGEYSSNVRMKVQKHYNAAFAVNNELVDINKLNTIPYKYTIPRINIHDPNPIELFFRINGFHKFFSK